MESIYGLMSSSLLRKSAKEASPEYRQQVPGIGKDFLRGEKDIFQAQDTSIHLAHPQPYTSIREKQVVMRDESPDLADIYGVKFTLTSGAAWEGRRLPTAPPGRLQPGLACSRHPPSRRHRGPSSSRRTFCGRGNCIVLS